MQKQKQILESLLASGKVLFSHQKLYKRPSRNEVSVWKIKFKNQEIYELNNELNYYNSILNCTLQDL